MHDLTIVIPAWNEEGGLGQVLHGLRTHPGLANAKILVVDDGSTDQTGRVARDWGVQVLRNSQNLGYGASLKKATRMASTSLVAWFDADGQHSPEDLRQMATLLLEQNLDAVLAERTLGGVHDQRRRFGKLMLRWLTRLCTTQKLRDPNCGLRVFRRRVISRYLHLLPEGFSASTTSTIALLKRNYRVAFHPVVARGRIAGKSSAEQLRDGLAALHTILHLTILFDAFRTFSTLAIGVLLIGLSYGLGWALYAGRGFPTFALLITLLGIQLFFLGVLCDQISAVRLERLEFTGEPENLD